MSANASMYFNQMGVPDYVGAAQEGISMGQMIKRNRAQDEEVEKGKKIQSLLSSTMSVGEDGRIAVDQAARNKGLAEIDPERAYKGQLSEDERKRKLEESKKAYMDKVSTRKQAQFNKDREFDLKKQSFQEQRDARIAENQKKGGPEKLTSQQVLKVQEGQDIPVMLQDVKSVLANNSDIMGPIEGRARGLNPWDERAATFNSQVKAASQAFGKFMEGGVLRKEDEEKYAKMFPSLSDTPDIAENKLSVVQRLLAQKQKGQVGALSRAGYDTAPFDSLNVPDIVNPAEKSAKKLAGVNESQTQNFDPSKPLIEQFIPEANASGKSQYSAIPLKGLAERRTELRRKAGLK